MTLVVGGKITIGPGISIESGPPVVAFSSILSTGSPWLYIYQWQDGVGFGSKFADPTVTPSGNRVNNLAFSANGDAIVVGTNGSPYVDAWAWTPGGFGTKYADPTVLPAGQVGSIAFTPNDDAIVLGHTNSPYISAYAWNSATGFGTRYADPSTALSGTAGALNFSPSGKALALISSGNYRVYAWDSATGFGSKYADPAGVTTAAGQGSSWHPSGQAVSFLRAGVSVAPSDYTFAWSDATGFGARYTPGAWGGANGDGITFTPDGTAYFLTVDLGIKWAPFDLTTGFGSVTNISLAGAALNAPVLTYDSKTVFVPDNNNTNGVYAYPWNINTGLGTRYASPSPNVKNITNIAVTK